MAVLDPLRLTITNYPEGLTEKLLIENHPKDDTMGTREVSFSRHLYIEREDFEEVPPPKYKRLYPGNEVRLKGAYLITCTGFVKDDDGKITEILCEYQPDSKGGNPADGHKVKGATIHWVDCETAVDAEVRLYSYLFADPDPDGPDKNFLDCLNPSSLSILTGCKLEACLAHLAMPVQGRDSEGFQFMRQGYFCLDNKDSSPDHLVFNESVALKDSFGK
jgi:glutaminyl-tRNA synthetase